MKTRHWIAWALSLALLAAVPATVWAQAAEPTLDQIYQAANAGQLPKAQQMVDQVLATHPNSAKAHYVKAELAARQRDASTAQQELATAERLAPGLPFAKPAAVQALRTQVQHLSSAPEAGSTRQMGGSADPADRAPAATGLPWGKVAIGAVILLGLVALMRRRTRGMAGGGYASGAAAGAPMGNAPMGSTGYGPGMQPGGGYGQPGYGPGYGPGYAQPGMGSGLGRGLATGLAVGAGAVAAQEIGRRMFHPDGSQVLPDAAGTGGSAWNDAGAMDNVDMGGQDFGINDTGSWDSGGGSAGLDAGDVGGGGDWDNNS